jgi:hypothetical protein
MKTLLIVPDSAARRAAGITRYSILTWTKNCPLVTHDIGVLCYANAHVLSGFIFRGLREVLGASIQTTDPEKVRKALGLSDREQGIELVAHD